MKDFPSIGLIKYGNVLFIHTAPLTTDGTMISNLEEFAAFRIAFATVLELNDVEEKLIREHLGQIKVTDMTN